MDTQRYMSPAVEDRQPVAPPLNTAAVNSDPADKTPAWRRAQDYDAPAVEDRRSVEGPMVQTINSF